MAPTRSLTLFWQMIGYWQVMFEALNKYPCDLIIDTIGVGFAYPLVKHVFGLKIVSYTHYPTISSDMLAQTDSV
jgi:alpha-1,2-mannosyltransferase